MYPECKKARTSIKTWPWQKPQSQLVCYVFLPHLCGPSVLACRFVWAEARLRATGHSTAALEQRHKEDTVGRDMKAIHLRVLCSPTLGEASSCIPQNAHCNRFLYKPREGYFNHFFWKFRGRRRPALDQIPQTDNLTEAVLQSGR